MIKPVDTKQAHKNTELAQNYGLVSANRLFEMMQNVSYQGANFKWETAHTSFSKTAAAALFTQFKNKPKNLADLEKTCIESFETQWIHRLEDESKNDTQHPKNEVKNNVVKMSH